MHKKFDPSSTIYVGKTDEATTMQILSDFFSSEFRGQTMYANPYSMDVMENDEYKRNKDKQDDFVYWPIYIDIVNDVPVTLQDTIAFTSNVLKLLWSKNLPAIAECDFEENLPWSGGIKSPAMPPERF